MRNNDISVHHMRKQSLHSMTSVERSEFICNSSHSQIKKTQLVPAPYSISVISRSSGYLNILIRLCFDMPVMESALPNISASVPFDSFNPKREGENASTAKVLEANSNYMANMILPEIVQSSRNYPLGPQCVITHSEVPDQSLLLDVDLYWYISKEKGCVECRVEINDTGISRKAITTDPRVIITRKPKRFEAYCCFLCRANFVTIVQALLHMKAFHRQQKKILIQDQDVFHDIDKAMEVPPVPLPWYVAKKVIAEHTLQAKTYPVSFSPHPTDASSTSIALQSSIDREANDSGDVNPVTNLLQAIVKEYGKQVQTVLFGKDFSEVKVQFEDKTSVLAHLPDLVSQEENDIKDEIDADEKLDFKVFRMSGDGEDEESCIVRMSNPFLAQKQIISALKQGVSQGTEEEGTNKQEHSTIDNSKEKSDQLSERNTTLKTPKIEETETSVHSPKKLNSRGRPSKTVRFMVGYPDSDEDACSSASDRTEREESSKATTVDTADDKKAKEDEGLKGVVSKLISTASKGRIPIDPTSPVSTVAPSTGVREEILATAALHAQNLPKNLSVPNFSSVLAVSSAAITPVITSLTSQPASSSGGMVRVQSWGGSAGPSNKFTLSTYTPNTLQRLENMTTSELRKSFLTAGRAFTYAEKIKLMKKLNDEDSMITQAHVRGSGKLSESDGSLPPPPVAPTKPRGRPRKSSSNVPQDAEESESSSASAATLITNANQEEDPLSSAVKRKSVTPWPTDGRKKRKSKYDLDQFLQPDLQPQLTDIPKMKRKASSSEGSDHDEKESIDNTEAREPNPTSLFEVMRASYPGFLPPRVFTGQMGHDIPTSYPTMLPSEYYGSGEWANAAMQTLRSLQSTIEAASSTKWEDHIRKDSVEEENDSTPSHYVVGSSQDDKCKAEPSPASPNLADNPIMQIAKQIMDEKMKAQSDVGANEGKRALSPLLTQEEKQMIRSRATSSGDLTTKTKEKTERERNLKISKSSDQITMALKPEERSPSLSDETIVAKKGDKLEFTDDLFYATLKKNENFTLKYCDNSRDTATEHPSSLEMSQIFQNSIDTFVKMRYVEKFSVCRVCGFELAVMDKQSESTMTSHVMEHSLKDLLQTRCNGKQIL